MDVVDDLLNLLIDIGEDILKAGHIFKGGFNGRHPMPIDTVHSGLKYSDENISESEKYFTVVQLSPS